SFRLKDEQGALVADVVSGSPADKAGIRAGDVIVSADGKPVTDGEALTHAVSSKAPGRTMEIGAIRDGSHKTFNVTLGWLRERGATRTTPEAPRSGGRGVQARPPPPDLAQHLELPAVAHGLAATSVEPGSPAERAGVREGDLILSVNGQPVRDAAELRSALSKDKDASTLLRIRRGDGYLFLTVPAA